MKPQNPFNKEQLEKEEAAKKAHDKAREQFLNDMRWVLSTTQGRRIVWWMLSQAGIYQDAFHQSGSVQSKNLGRQQVGRELLNEVLNANEEAYFQMMREQKGEKNV